MQCHVYQIEHLAERNPTNKNGSICEQSKILKRVKFRELQGQTGSGCGCLKSHVTFVL